MAVTVLYDNTGAGAPVAGVFAGDGTPRTLTVNIQGGGSVTVQATLETAPEDKDWVEVLATKGSFCLRPNLMNPVTGGLKLRAAYAGPGKARVLLA